MTIFAYIDGKPEIKSRISGGLSGDIATCAITLIAVRSIFRTGPDLKTIGRNPPMAFFNEAAE